MQYNKLEHCVYLRRVTNDDLVSGFLRWISTYFADKMERNACSGVLDTVPELLWTSETHVRIQIMYL